MSNAQSTITYFPAESTTTPTGSSSSSSGKDAQKWMLQLRKEYRDSLGVEMPVYLQQDIRKALEEEGISFVWYMSYALREASMAPRPSWAYARAVLRRLRTEKADPAMIALQMLQSSL